jgi:hypothetical protein
MPGKHSVTPNLFYNHEAILLAKCTPHTAEPVTNLNQQSPYTNFKLSLSFTLILCLFKRKKGTLQAIEWFCVCQIRKNVVKMVVYHLKGQLHEISGPLFFHQSTLLGP